VPSLNQSDFAATKKIPLRPVVSSFGKELALPATISCTSATSPAKLAATSSVPESTVVPVR
jgi:hypothetical protein